MIYLTTVCEESFLFCVYTSRFNVVHSLWVQLLMIGGDNFWITNCFCCVVCRIIAAYNTCWMNSVAEHLIRFMYCMPLVGFRVNIITLSFSLINISVVRFAGHGKQDKDIYCAWICQWRRALWQNSKALFFAFIPLDKNLGSIPCLMAE